MEIFNTSSDFLKIAGGAAILALGIFISLGFFYLAMILRQVFKASKEMRERLTKLDEIIDKLHYKLDKSVSYLSLIGEGVKKIVEIANEHGKKKTKKKK